MKALKSFAYVAVLLLSSAISADAQSAHEDIVATLTKFMEAFNSGNAVAVAELYTEDAAVLPPDGKRVDGRKGVEEFWQGAIKGGMKNLTLKAIEVEERTDLAYEVGAFTLDMPSEGGGLSTVLSTSPYRKSGNVRQDKRGRLEAAAPREKRARRRAPGLSSGPAWASCAV